MTHKHTYQPKGAHISLQDMLAIRQVALRSHEFDAAKRFSLAGENAHMRLGQGMEYAEVRPYAPNDDARHIDWRVTARKNATHIKLYHEQFDSPMYFVLDQSASLFFGSKVCFKSVTAAALTAWFFWKAHALGHPIGCSLCLSDVVQVVQPRGGEAHIMQLCQQVVQANCALNAHMQPAHVITFERALNCLMKEAKKYSTLFVMSDIWSWSKAVASAVATLSKMTQVRLCLAFDTLEKKLPHYGVMRLTNHQQVTVVDSSVGQVRTMWQQAFDKQRQTIEDFCKRHAVQLQLFATHQPLGA